MHFRPRNQEFRCPFKRFPSLLFHLCIFPVMVLKKIGSWSNSKFQLYLLTTCVIFVILYVTIYSTQVNQPESRTVLPQVNIDKALNIYVKEIQKTLKESGLNYHERNDNEGNGSNNDPRPSSTLSKEFEQFQLNLDHCKILNVPLTSDSFTRTQRAWEKSTCSGGFSSWDDKGNLIIKDFDEKCCYEVISRPESMIEDQFRISSTCLPIPKQFSQINEDFFRIKCPAKNPDAAPMFEYHTSPKLTERIKKKIEFWDLNVPSSSDRPPSVLMLAIDATSRTNLYRSLPNTVRQLKEMEFIDFKGHHIQGEPTFPNAIPLLMGVESESFWKLNKTNRASRWDEFPFIWKEFHRLNYLTFFMEDEQKHGTFNYGVQKGFRYQPTDVYPRPLLLAREGSRLGKDDKIPCFGNQSMPDYLLDYLNRFLEKIKGIPSFSLSWLTWPQHDFTERLPDLDSPLTTFLTVLSKHHRVLEDTVIILFSDHGSWNAPYSETPEGRLERRLPFLFIRYPQKLQTTSIGIEQLDNLRKNQNTLTTHYDTHQTLLELVNMAAIQVNKTLVSSNGKGLSLLGKISTNRTCLDANIGSFLCACNLMLPVHPKNAIGLIHAAFNSHLNLPPLSP